MGWKRLVIISGLFLLVSCVSFYHHPKGGFRPKKPNFSLAKEAFVYNKAIDTMAIYVNIDTLKVEDLISVSYIKFYNNGRAFKSSKFVDEKLTFYNFKPLDIGYYNTANNKITIETFIVDPLNKYNTEYVIEKGVITGDTVILESRFIEGKKEVYVKQTLNFNPEPSDW